MLAIRLSGTAAEVTEALVTLTETFPISAIKGLCPSAASQSTVRVTMEVRNA